MAAYRHLVLVRLGYPISLKDAYNRECEGDIYPLQCYGAKPIEAVWSLSQFMRFVVHNEMNQDPPAFTPLNGEETAKTIRTLYTADIRTGAYRSNHALEEGTVEIVANPARGPWPQHPDCGVSFVDLRDPAKPKYCFLFADEVEDHIQRTPMSAAEFIEACKSMYLDDNASQTQKNSFAAEVGEAVASMRGFELMDAEELCDAYPQYMLAEEAE